MINVIHFTPLAPLCTLVFGSAIYPVSCTRVKVYPVCVYVSVFVVCPLQLPLYQTLDSLERNL